MWQKCPICNGTGMTAPNYQSSSATGVPCTVCHGAKIINDLTGLPPNIFIPKDKKPDPNADLYKNPLDKGPGY